MEPLVVHMKDSVHSAWLIDVLHGIAVGRITAYFRTFSRFLHEVL